MLCLPALFLSVIGVDDFLDLRDVPLTDLTHIPMYRLDPWS